MDRQAVGQCDALRHAQADAQACKTAGTARDGQRVEIGEADTALGEQFANPGNEQLGVPARGQLFSHADLAVDIQRDGAEIGRRFEPQADHAVSFSRRNWAASAAVRARVIGGRLLRNRRP